MRLSRALALSLIFMAACSSACQAYLYEIDLFKNNIIPAQYHASIRNGTCNVDLISFIQAAIDSLGPQGGIVYFPTGRYRIDKPIQLPSSRPLTAQNSPPVQLIGSSSFMGGTKHNYDPPGWNGTTLFSPNSSLPAFINLNLSLTDSVLIRPTNSIKGWKIIGLRFEGGTATQRYRRQAVRGAFVEHGLFEDCEFNSFSPAGTDTSAAVIQLNYKGKNGTGDPYVENVIFNRVLFSRCSGTYVRA